LVCALILKELKGISYDELIEGVVFDLHFKTGIRAFMDWGYPFFKGNPIQFLKQDNRI